MIGAARPHGNRTGNSHGGPKYTLLTVTSARYAGDLFQSVPFFRRSRECVAGLVLWATRVLLDLLESAQGIVDVKTLVMGLADLQGEVEL